MMFHIQQMNLNALTAVTISFMTGMITAIHSNAHTLSKRLIQRLVHLTQQVSSASHQMSWLKKSQSSQSPNHFANTTINNNTSSSNPNRARIVTERGFTSADGSGGYGVGGCAGDSSNHTTFQSFDPCANLIRERRGYTDHSRTSVKLEQTFILHQTASLQRRVINCVRSENYQGNPIPLVSAGTYQQIQEHQNHILGIQTMKIRTK